MNYPSETRVVICPFCGTLNRAVLSYRSRTKDDDWDDGACTRCAQPIISEWCACISWSQFPASPQVGVNANRAGPELWRMPWSRWIVGQH